MILVLLVLVPFVLVAAAAVWLLRWWPAPVHIGGEAVEAPSNEAPPTIRILTTNEELRAAIERAAATERRLATLVGGRADRYDRLNRGGAPAPAPVAGRPDTRTLAEVGDGSGPARSGWISRRPS